MSFGRPFVARVEKAQRDARESKEQELERNAREADFKSIMAKIESDMEILENRFSDKGESALAHARDLKYIRDRQKSLYPPYSICFAHKCGWCFKTFGCSMNHNNAGLRLPATSETKCSFPGLMSGRGRTLSLIGWASIAA